jgi:hypothetical protein
MSDELQRDVPCTDPDCGTVLGWPDASICEDCGHALEQQGIVVEDEQLEFLVPDEEQPA